MNIDPPYNTGNAFDYYDDNLEHSTWLNLMKPRIDILRSLLSEDGFICCHIDDSEGHYLKIIMDEIFDRNNYLTTLYIQVRYANKTLAEDNDYQKVIEQCLIYSKNKTLCKTNKILEDYKTEKFEWEIKELGKGIDLELGGKKVKLFKPNEYDILRVEPSYTGLKETWATGSLVRQKASSGEFLELYLAPRKEIDGIGCMYKVYGMGEDGLGYRYFTGPKKQEAAKGKFYSGIPLDRLELLKQGKGKKEKPIPNFYDFSGNFGNCRLEGNVDFRGGKKPEALLEMILSYFSNPGDIVLDSFLGSGTTAAVAHKMGRKWIGIELGEHCYSHCIPRLQNVINGSDQGGISKSAGWQGGGGFKFYELAPSLLKKDKYGNFVIDKDNYNGDMLAAAMAKLNGFTYCPDETVFWKQGYSYENGFIFTTTQFITMEYLDLLAQDIKGDESLLICCQAFQEGADMRYDNISITKIPQSVLKECDFGVDNYNLNIINPPELDDEVSGDE